MATADGKQCSIFDAAAQHLIIPDVRCGGLRVVGPTKLWANGEHGVPRPPDHPRPSDARWKKMMTPVARFMQPWEVGVGHWAHLTKRTQPL